VLETIFEEFVQELEEKGIATRSGSIVDARWATKNKEVHYGYKSHIKIDKKSKIITKYRTTSAEVHDSRELKNLIEEGKDKRIYGDSAYTGEEVQSCIPETAMNRIHETPSARFCSATFFCARETASQFLLTGAKKRLLPPDGRGAM